jgi:hypothetical protein
MEGVDIAYNDTDDSGPSALVVPAEVPLSSLRKNERCPSHA